MATENRQSGRLSSHPPTRLTSIAYLAIGTVALCGAGYDLGLLVAGEERRGLVVVGSPKVEVEHPDRKQPLEVAFGLRNPTGHPIRITSVSSDCRCTTGSLSGREIAPGETIRLDVRVDSFDTYLNDFAHRVEVATTDGPIELLVAGEVDPERGILYSPRRLYLEPTAAGSWPERTIRLRVPKGCAREPSEVEVRPIMLGDTAAEVSETAPSRHYREYVVRLAADPDPTPGEGEGHLRIEAGCTPLEIPVRFATSPRRGGDAP